MGSKVRTLLGAWRIELHELYLKIAREIGDRQHEAIALMHNQRNGRHPMHLRAEHIFVCRVVGDLISYIDRTQ